MRAAVVNAFDVPPVYQDHPAPSPGAGRVLVDVLAAGLHPRVRSQADGSHYTSTGVLPLVPGIDGVGRTSDGELRYFVLPDTEIGSMAEQTLIDPRRSVLLPEGSDPVVIAAAMNPAMSSWVALRRRIAFEPGQSVLVLGATGNAGGLAVQVARLLGAGRIVGAGRDRRKLDELAGGDDIATVSLVGSASEVGERLAQEAGGIDIVLDYLWGTPATAAIRAIVTGRPDRSRPLTWVQIGAVAGPEAPVPSAALRAARLQIVGSGQGSVATADIVAELAALATAVNDRAFRIETDEMPLRDVATAWLDTGSGRRIVLVP